MHVFSSSERIGFGIYSVSVFGLWLLLIVKTIYC